MARNTRVDLARGLLMLYVIAVVHGIYWLNIAMGSARSILLVEMPSIFFVSGVAFYLSQTKGMQIASAGHYLRYLARRAARILIPYWCYGIACLCFLFLQIDPVAFGPAGPKLPAIAAWLNPFEYGGSHSLLSLNSHLWFIPVFLAVTALMPLLAMLAAMLRIANWALLPLCLCAVLAADLYLGDFARNVITYAAWATIGYAAASDKDFLRPRRAAALSAVSVALLMCVPALGFGTLDMQANKFPPNATFFLFGTAWLCALLAACSFAGDSLVARLAGSRLLRPFVRNGYSLYLWQGLAYTLAAYAGARLGLPVVLVWLIAVLSAIGLGSLAAPLESIQPFGARKRKQSRPATIEAPGIARDMFYDEEIGPVAAGPGGAPDSFRF